MSAASIDLDAIRRKYREERDRRLGADRDEDDAPELTGSLARYRADPHVEVTAREPRRDEVTALVVGGGFSGLLSAVRLKEAGIESVRILDNAGDVGGVWYWNRYPGAMCDVESYIYLPLLEELGYIPTRKYAYADEIFGHAQAISRRYRLYDQALFHTEVEAMLWDDRRARWVVETDRGDRMRAQFVVLANGPFSRARLPTVDGLERFEGHSFHASRWDYEYTGGGIHEELTGLHDKVVGLVGTGATGIQCVPPLGRAAKHLYVFQRTPSTIAVRANRPTDEEWAADLKPGWQRQRIENFTMITAGEPVDEDLVSDGWTDLYQDLLAGPKRAGTNPEEVARASELIDARRMELIRQRIDAVVTDEQTAETLKPYYSYLCKRACFHDEYLMTFNRPNVTLVDAAGEGMQRIDARGVVVNGQPYELDCLIFATGYEVNSSYSHRIGFDPRGRGGLTLSQHWSQGIRTLHGLMAHGFPNLMVIPGLNSQAVVTTNFMHTFSECAHHIAYVVASVRARAATVFDVTAEAEDEWVGTILARAPARGAFLESCTPGRRNYEGRLDKWPAQNANYSARPMEFFQLLEEWRAEGRLRGLEVTS